MLLTGRKSYDILFQIIFNNSDSTVSTLHVIIIIKILLNYIIYVFIGIFFSSSLQFSVAPLAPPGSPQYENHWLREGPFSKQPDAADFPSPHYSTACIEEQDIPETPLCITALTEELPVCRWMKSRTSSQCHTVNDTDLSLAWQRFYLTVSLSKCFAASFQCC